MTWRCPRHPVVEDDPAVGLPHLLHAPQHISAGRAPPGSVLEQRRDGVELARVEVLGVRVEERPDRVCVIHVGQGRPSPGRPASRTVPWGTVAARMAFRAVIFDLGGVVFPSPFDVFAAYERDHGLPDRFIRGVVAASADHGAWARLERSELSFDEFAVAFSAECAAAGGTVDAADLMREIGRGFEPRPAMVQAIAAIRAHGLKVGSAHEQLGAEQHGPWRPRPHAARAPGRLRRRGRVRGRGAAQARSAHLRAGVRAARASRRPKRCSSTTSASTSSPPARWG